MTLFTIFKRNSENSFIFISDYWLNSKGSLVKYELTEDFDKKIMVSKELGALIKEYLPAEFELVPATL